MTTVLATGAFLKNRAGLWRHGHWTASAIHGDLGTAEARSALDASVDRLLTLAGGRVDAVAHDLHPDFHSTRLAQALAGRLGVPAIGVQHHHAHMAVVLDEGAIDGPVIGIALDGFGLGSDGGAWGGELLWLDGPHCRRVGHLKTLPLPGGDRAAREPWRLAAAVLQALGRGDEIEPRFAADVGTATARGLRQMLERGLHCRPTSSAGRWFDAAAAALGLSLRQSHEAEAAMALEACAAGAAEAATAVPPAPVCGGIVDLYPVLAALLQPVARDAQAAHALAFHHALADGLAQAAADAAVAAGTRTVVLGGGCLCNRLLSARLQAQLAGRGLVVRQPALADCGDAGLARGQAWVAAMQVDALRALQPTPARAADPMNRDRETTPCA